MFHVQYFAENQLVKTVSVDLPFLPKNKYLIAERIHEKQIEQPDKFDYFRLLEEVERE